MTYLTGVVVTRVEVGDDRSWDFTDDTFVLSGYRDRVSVCDFVVDEAIDVANSIWGDDWDGFAVFGAFQTTYFRDADMPSSVTRCARGDCQTRCGRSQVRPLSVDYALAHPTGILIAPTRVSADRTWDFTGDTYVLTDCLDTFQTCDQVIDAMYEGIDGVADWDGFEIFECLCF